jgi:hypothetical protein
MNKQKLSNALNGEDSDWYLKYIVKMNCCY